MPHGPTGRIVPCAIAQSCSPPSSRERISHWQTAWRFPFADGSCPGDKIVAPCRPQVVDLEFGGQGVTAEGEPAGKCQRVVRKITQHASMNKAVLLAVMAGNGQADLGMVRADRKQLRSDPAGEWLRSEDFLRERLQVGHRQIFLREEQAIKCFMQPSTSLRSRRSGDLSASWGFRRRPAMSPPHAVASATRPALAEAR